MSGLAKTFAKTKLSSLPPELPLYEDHEREDDSSSASSMSSTGTVIPTSSQRPAPAIHWSDYFAQEFYLERPETSDSSHGKFHVYLTPPSSDNGVLLVLHHGAGSSALSFALFAQEVRRTLPKAGVLAVEARDHGSVVYHSDGTVNSEFSVELLSQDLLSMIQLTSAKMAWKEPPPIVLIGHSLGGAVVTDVAHKGLLGGKLLGYAVLDVVEGSALEALKHMQAYLSTRPKSFASLAAAIEWHIRSRTLRNPRSARASVPSLLLQNSEGRWVWKTDLSSTEPYWENWFTGMSGKFLTGRGAKLLLLAGTDRLDKELMIGQMQGESSQFFIYRFVIFLLLVSTQGEIDISCRQVSAASLP
jgi:protein phosphatase methylesterase 1